MDLLEDAGFVLFGRTNSPEFGPLTVSENQRWGKTRNPWNPDYTSGGSSGGASAAVAAGTRARRTRVGRRRIDPRSRRRRPDSSASSRVADACRTTSAAGSSRPPRARSPARSATRPRMLDVLGVSDPLGVVLGAADPTRPYLEEVGAADRASASDCCSEPPTGRRGRRRLRRGGAHRSPGRSSTSATTSSRSTPFLFTRRRCRASPTSSSPPPCGPRRSITQRRQARPLHPLSLRQCRATFHAGEYVALANRPAVGDPPGRRPSGAGTSTSSSRPRPPCRHRRVGPVIRRGEHRPDGPRA